MIKSNDISVSKTNVQFKAKQMYKVLVNVNVYLLKTIFIQVNSY